MPRSDPKSKTGNPVFAVRGIVLSEETKTELANCLGFPPGAIKSSSLHDSPPEARAPTDGDRLLENVLRETSYFLDAYRQGEQALDKPPLPSDYIATFQPINKQAKKLYDSLKGLTPCYREQLIIEGKPNPNDDPFEPLPGETETDVLEEALASVIGKTDSILQRMESHKQDSESRGAKKEIALRFVITNLRGIFRKYYNGEITTSKRVGAFIYKSAPEKQEFEFVKTALAATRMVAKVYLCQKLKVLFTDLDQVPEE